MPELETQNIREIILGTYRLIYRIEELEVQILTIHHGPGFYQRPSEAATHGVAKIQLLVVVSLKVGQSESEYPRIDEPVHTKIHGLAAGGVRVVLEAVYR